MLRVLVQPRWLAWHAALAGVLVAFTLLGRWQLSSFEETGKDRSGPAAPVELTTLSRPGERLGGDEVGRAVTARGAYTGEQALVPARSVEDRNGYLVVSALRAAGGVVPVNRGWVRRPRDPATRVPAGTVTVTGVLAPSESAEDSRVDPLAPLPHGQVPYLATVQLLDVWSVDPREIYDGYVVLASQQPAASPAPRPVEPPEPDRGVGRWRNLAYALQWWLFAGAAVVFWWTVIRRSTRPAEAREPAPV